MKNLFLTAALIAWSLGALPAGAATLQHRYDFSSDASDAIGTADGVLLNGAYVSDGQLHLGGGDDYVDLPAGEIAINTYTALTLELWSTQPVSPNQSYTHTVSVGDTWGNGNGRDYLNIACSRGDDTSLGAIAITADQESPWNDESKVAGPELRDNTEHLYTLVIDETTLSFYIDGVSQGTTALAAWNSLSAVSTSAFYLGKGVYSGDAFWMGDINEFRIYEGAMTESEVLDSYIAGPDVAPGGAVEITADPESLAVDEGAPAAFQIETRGTTPIQVQWYRDSSPIEGATNDLYTIPVTALSDHGATFYAVASNSFMGVAYGDTSATATLTVNADTTPPTLVQANSLYPFNVQVQFSESVTEASAENPDNYTILYDGGTLNVTGAVLQEDPAIVILSTDEQILGTIYTLYVSNIQDRSSAGNTIVPESEISFVAVTYTTEDIGNPAISSTVDFVSGGLDMTSAGSGIGGSTDQIGFSHKSYVGDFDVQVRMDGMEFADGWARGGLMARDGLASNARFAAAFASTGPAGCQFMSRSSIGAAAAATGFFPVSFPSTWLRLRRTGNLFEAFAGIDGQTWQLLGSATISMSSSVEVGFALTSADTGTAVTAGFRDESVGSGSIVSSIPLPFEPLGASSRRGAMVISEIMVDAPSAWGGTNSLEFVEIYNSGLITEDLTGHRFTGEIDYTFPAGTMLAPGQFIVVAKDPAAAQSFYGVPCLGPYDGKLANNGGLLRLRNEIDGILLELEYNDKAPWPVAAFGTGHSLVLSHPSYGEGDPRAWSASDVIGGSPGTYDGYGFEPARGVVINEYLAHTDLPQVDAVELFNTGLDPVDLSGFWLSDSAGTNRYRIADGTTIDARGFLSYDETQLGFRFSADGEQIFLVNSNLTRVIDAVSFRGQANGVSEGRYPDGAPDFQRLSSVTLGNANTEPLQSPVVINEIMYHPISDSKNDEYVELYNRSGGAVDLSGWRLQGGISYEFPSNTVLAANAYLVVAENATNLIAKYSQLNTANTYGNYSGSLADGGETIRLSMIDDLISTNEFGVVITNMFHIPVDEVSYLDGGRWGDWSDGGGSSLELIDPDADNRYPSNWADSDETAKAGWTVIDVTDILENGQAGYEVDEGSVYGDTYQCNRLELFLQGPGEALVDDVEFRNNGGSSLVQNGSFSSGSNNWGFGGVLRNTFIESGVGYDGSTALHLVSVARGDTGANKVYNNLNSLPSITGSDTGTIRAKVRWIRGSKQILIRLRGNWMEVCQDLEVPDDLGTPGQANSQQVANAGPVIHDVTHFPVLPAAGEDVVVTARVSDPDGLAAVFLSYRLDPGPLDQNLVEMNDDGTGGDAVAGDGLYSATISGQSSGALVAFYVLGVDGGGTAYSTFPAAIPERECLVRWGESLPTGWLGSYHLWLTADNIDFWTSREKNANDTIDATFVYGNQRVVYNVDTMYSGSPFHVGAYDSPVGRTCDYEINFHPGERFLGSKPFVLAGEDTVSTDFWDDPTTQIDLTGTWVARQLGQQYNYRRHVHMYVNGNRRGDIYLDTQQPNSEMLDEYFPNDSNGDLRKIESWFEFADDFTSQGSVYARLVQRNKTLGGIDTKWYRWNWRPRATDDHNNWYSLTNLISEVNDSSSPDWEGRVRNWMDVRNFLRPIAVHHACGSWDSYAYERGKNMYAYKSDDGLWRLMMWDIELAMSNDGRSTSDDIYKSEDPALTSMVGAIPAFHREYLMAFQEIVDGPFAPGVANVILNERYANLIANGVPVASPQPIINWISGRRSYLQGVLPSDSFAVDGPPSFTVSSNSVVFTGSAPLQVADILVNDILFPIEWTDTTAWSMAVPLLPGTNVLSFAGYDRLGNPVDGATASRTVISTADGGDPLDQVVINEWMADNDNVIIDPADGDYDDWFELYNPGTETVDLGGCYLTDELTTPFEYQIPDNGHYTIEPGGYLLVWADGESGQNSTNLPDLHVEFSLSKNGDSIGLFAPDGREIDAVTFGPQLTDVSEGRSPDGSDNIITLPVPTPGGSNNSLPVMGDIMVDGTNLYFSWVSESGSLYQVYYTDDLMEDLWLPLGDPIPGTGGSIGFSNTVMDALHRFYILEVTSEP